MSTGDLFQRRYSVQVGERLFRDLRVSFNVKRSDEKTPNTAEATIYNLSPDSRAYVEASRGKLFAITAGYENSEGLIFSGEVRLAQSSRPGVDWLTKIESGDGEDALSLRPARLSFGKNAGADQVLRAAVQQLGIKEGNLSTIINAGLSKLTHSRGFSASGRASDVLTNLLAEQGLTYSVQNGALQIVKPNTAANSKAILLSVDSGLIGSPEIETPSDKTKGARIKARSFLQAAFAPGGIVAIKARLTNNQQKQFLIRKVEHSGDNRQGGWYSDIEATPL